MYWKLLSFVILVGLVNSVLSISGGQDAPDGKYPFMARFRYRGGKENFCSATILTKSLVLTAAHCLHDEDYGDLYVTAGSNTLRLDTAVSKKVLNCFLHPNYTHQENKVSDHDVAICRLQSPFMFNNRIKAVKLRSINLPNVSVGSEVQIVGWGNLNINDTHPNGMQHANIEILNQQICKKYYNRYSDRLSICAGTKNNNGPSVCYGDSGGALLYNNEQIGITAYSLDCLGEPSVFQSVKTYYNWIAHIKEIFKN